MKNNIKLIWEFRGPNAHGIAEHHKIHLEEYCKNNKIEHLGAGTEDIHPTICLAYLIVDLSLKTKIGNDLKPQFATTKF